MSTSDAPVCQLRVLPDDACRSGVLRLLRGFDGHAE